MQPTITAQVEFYFKGKAFTPKLELDLNEIMQRFGRVPDLYTLLADSNNIDNYSYEFEVMMSEEIQFSNPSSDVIPFIHGNHFDHLAFEQDWHQRQLLKKLAPLIKAKLDIDDIEQHPELKHVLLATYQHAKGN